MRQLTHFPFLMHLERPHVSIGAFLVSSLNIDLSKLSINVKRIGPIKNYDSPKTNIKDIELTEQNYFAKTIIF